MVKQAYRLNVPVRPVSIAKTAQTWSTSQYLSINQDNVIIETVKKAEDNSGIIIRLYECKNIRTNAQIQWHQNIKNVRECDLMENEISDVLTDGTTWQFNIKPFHFTSFFSTFL